MSFLRWSYEEVCAAMLAMFLSHSLSWIAHSGSMAACEKAHLAGDQLPLNKLLEEVR